MRCGAALVLLCAASLAGCNARGRLTQAQPHAGATPARLSFGETPILFPVQRTVLISDGGTVALHVSAARIEDDAGAAFSVSSAEAKVAAGSTFELSVRFRPPARGAFAATLVFETDDPDHPTFSVPLDGSGTTSAALEARPSPLDFGRVGEGQTALRELTLKSVGQADLYLGGIGFAPGTPDLFAVVGSLQPPLVLPISQAVTIAIRFSPVPGLALGTSALRLDSSDPQHPALDVPLLATVNRAPLPSARGRLGGDAPRQGPIDVAVGATVGLDATASTDPDGDLPLRYRWTIALRPQGSAATIADAAAVTTSIRLDAPGSYSLLLDATDATGLPSVMPSRLDLRALPPEQLLVELVWDKVAPDLDLHFAQDGQERNSDGDCSWTNPAPQWFAGGEAANPRHQGDKLTGYGPERVAWKQPGDGRYRLDVVYKADHAAVDPSTTALVRVYAFGQIIAELKHLFARQGEAWTAGFVDWPQARVEVAP